MQQCVIYQSCRFKRCCSYGNIIIVCYFSGLLSINNCRLLAGGGEYYEANKKGVILLQVANYGDLPSQRWSTLTRYI